MQKIDVPESIAKEWNRLLAAGLSYSQLARRYGVARSMMRRVLAEHGLYLQGKIGNPRKFTAEQRKEAKRSYVKRTIVRHKQRLKNYKFMMRYGITLVQYNDMVGQQNGLCRLCSKERKLYVDHCHVTGKVRALLCNFCNSAYGQFKENADIIYAAIAYLYQPERYGRYTKKTAPKKRKELADLGLLCCGICESGGVMYVDHEHSTGLVRGVLCERCNFGLGFAEDSPSLLRKMLSYPV